MTRTAPARAVRSPALVLGLALVAAAAAGCASSGSAETDPSGDLITAAEAPAGDSGGGAAGTTAGAEGAEGGDDAAAPGHRPVGGTDATAGDPAATPGEADAAAAAAYDERLPEIPEVTGPLDVHIQYPGPNQRIAVRDSNFLFGTVGRGDALLIIDGHIVDVEPNGAFLAWLPVPPASHGDTAYYAIVARSEEQTETLRHPILLPRRPEAPPADATVWMASSSSSITSGAQRWALPDEPLEIAVRATAGATVWLDTAEDPVPLERVDGSVGGGARRARDARDPRPGSGLTATFRTRMPAGELWQRACTLETCTADTGSDSLRLAFVAAASGDTVRYEFDLPLRVLDPADLPVLELREEPDTVNGTNGMVVARPLPYGPYRWRFPEGTRAVADGRIGGRVRLRLADGTEAWVETDDVVLVPWAEQPPASAVPDLRFVPGADRITLRVPMASALPVDVSEPDERTIVLDIYGARGNTNRVAFGAGEGLLEDVRWQQLAGPVYRLTMRLTRPVWGWQISYEDAGDPPWAASGGAGAVLRFEIRRPPAIDPDDPLEGRRIAVDPGHPGAGATGPTGYYEGEANLAIGRRLAELLREEGAVPILIRNDAEPVGLYERTNEAMRAGAELFISIHNNALPDGVRPYGEQGTSTYYYQPHAKELAEHLQAGMLESMRLRDLGVFWGDLAVARLAWMPSVLAEGAFMMHPRHEAALRTPEFQELYAQGVLEGIESFLRDRAELQQEAED